MYGKGYGKLHVNSTSSTADDHAVLFTDCSLTLTPCRSKVAEKAYQVATSIMCDETGEVLASIQTRVGFITAE